MDFMDLDTSAFQNWFIFVLPIAVVVARNKYVSATKEAPPQSVLQRAINRFSTNKFISHINWNLSLPFLHQVAGHTNEVLRKLAGKILKPQVKQGLFIREVAYYENMEDLGSHSVGVVNAFTPEYYGCTFSNGDTNPLHYLVLKDLTLKFKDPCVMDIKMGTQTFEPSADSAKKQREVKKYSHQSTIGFRITGFKVFNIVAEDYYFTLNKSLGRSLNPDNVLDGLSVFFYNGSFVRRDVILAVISKLEQILTWLKSQINYHFYCSSLLIIYDGKCNSLCERSIGERASSRIDDAECKVIDGTNYSALVPPCIRKDLCGSKLPCQGMMCPRTQVFRCYDDFVEVRMIDFAHVVASNSYLSTPSVDNGYIKGLTNLIICLQNILYSANL